jgi:CUG-BP- and ETR3-like factor
VKWADDRKESFHRRDDMFHMYGIEESKMELSPTYAPNVTYNKNSDCLSPLPTFNSPLTSPLHYEHASSTKPIEGPPGANLFVYHLPKEVSDADLMTLFNPFGYILSAKVYMDKKTEESKGFGFVSFQDVSYANSAIVTMNGFQLGNKRLKVQHKKVSDDMTKWM